MAEPINSSKRAGEILNEIVLSQTPGIQYVFVNKKEVVYEFSGGFADLSEKKLMEGHITMNVYDLTKPFTAISILQLYEKNMLSLDDPVEKYIDFLPYKKNITIFQLLTHRAGLPNPKPFRWIHKPDEADEFDEELEFVKITEKFNTLKYDPGTDYFYSNIGYWILGNIIGKVSGYDYKTYVKNNILRKINLFPTDIDFVAPDLKNHAKGYLAGLSFKNFLKKFITEKDIWGKYEGKWLHVLPHYVNGPAYGGLVASARTMSRFVNDQLKEKSVLFEKPETASVLYSEIARAGKSDAGVTPGWHSRENEGEKFFYAKADGGGYNGEMRIYPEKNAGSVILVNRTKFDSTNILNKLDNLFIK